MEGGAVAMEGGAGGGGSPADALQQVVRLVRDAMGSLSSQSLAQRFSALPTGDHDDMLDRGDVVAGALPQNVEKNRCEPSIHRVSAVAHASLPWPRSWPY